MTCERTPFPALESRSGYELLSVSEVSVYLRVSEPTVRELWREARLEGVEIGRRLFFTRDDVIEFITGGRRRDRTP
jgi:excisionase family DNA binding protein